MKSELKDTESKAMMLTSAEAKITNLETALYKEQELASKRSARIAELERVNELAKTQGRCNRGEQCSRGIVEKRPGRFTSYAYTGA